MALTTQQRTNLDGFPKPAELIEISGTSSLEAQDRALLNTLYRHAHDSGSLCQPGASWSVRLADIRTSSHESNDRIRQSLSRLLGIQVAVTFTDAAGKGRVLQTVLFEHFITSKEKADSTLEFAIPAKLREILVKSGRWGRIKAEIVHAMSSKYAIALYELLRLRANLENCTETFPILRFRSFLGVPQGTYENGNNFFRKVIEPAVLEVNAISEMGCQVELVRAHARAPITGVTVAWWYKNPKENREAVQELSRSKVGRKARLRGVVERTS